MCHPSIRSFQRQNDALKASLIRSSPFDVRNELESGRQSQYHTRTDAAPEWRTRARGDMRESTMAVTFAPVGPPVAPMLAKVADALLQALAQPKRQAS
jgi:hypothetical protein